VEDAKRERVTQIVVAFVVVVLAGVVWWVNAEVDGRHAVFPAGRSGITWIEDSASSATAAPTGVDPESGLPWISSAELPPEALDTLDEIAAGPPYPFDRDGVTFENREGLLPQNESGYYQEFTVPTPGTSDRGARRIVRGLQDEFYYTDDHYASFSRIAP
jgi:ribonuclease T1